MSTVVGLVGQGGPHLLSVDHPLVAVALGAGLQAGDVGPGARLREHLAPHRLARDVVGHEGPLLLLGAELVQHRQAHAVADHEAARHRREVLGDGPVDALVLERESGTAVLLGVRQTGEAGGVQLALKFTRLVDVSGRGACRVLGEERTATLGKGVRLLGGEGGARHRRFSRLVLYGGRLYAAIQS
jgi:hypothetical protein